MIVTCPSCSARFRVAQGQIGPEGRKVRCGNCGHVWQQRPVAEEPLDLSEPVPEPPTESRPLAAGTLSAGLANAGPAVEKRPLETPRVSERRLDRGRGAEEAYDQPSFMNPPAVDDEALFGDNGKERRRRGSGWGMTLLLILLLFVALAAAAWYWRNDIVARLPALAPVYESLGVPVATVREPRLELLNATFMPRLENGARKLLVSGLLGNPSDRTLPVPPLRISVTDQNGREITAWTFQPEVRSLAPNNTLRFESLNDHPEYDGTIDVTVTLEPTQ